MKKNKFDKLASLLPVDLRGVVMLITGQYGSGKSILSLLDPYNTQYIDADYGKGIVLANQIPGIAYTSVNSLDIHNASECGDRFMTAIEKIDLEKTTTVIIDNFYEVQEGLRVYAIKNPVDMAKRFGLLSKAIASRSYGNDTIAAEKVLKGIINYLTNSQVSVVIMTHMKDKWYNDKKVLGQKEVKAREWVLEASSLVLILTRTGKEPDAIVLKSAYSYVQAVDPSKLSADDLEKYRMGELEPNKIIQRFPLKIPAITVGKIYRYLGRTPEQADVPYSPEETIDMAELQPYSEILSTGQLAKLEKIIEHSEAEAEAYRQERENIMASQRAALDQDILDYDIETPVKDIIAGMKLKYEMFAAEITPIYILKVRQAS